MSTCDNVDCVLESEHEEHCSNTREWPELRPDPVNPSHYVKRGIEVRNVIRAFECTYNVGTAVAYLLRAPFKGRYLEDIRKAIQHLNFELEDKGGGDGVGDGRVGSK